ncbi:periplasmic heavy metal sensor [Ruegeria lacuscaerulensis]|uniref:periplasmic heavy metal sensor n=1 Tax=Ruegeria lacuscaerulensis TaxID=55218 RepID=UPI0014805BC6|nr:periplasmic heavy metal sensor [Ruegeria lacuscaerulensis]
MSDNPKPKRRWVKVLLAVSLGFNLLVVGVAVGTVLRVKGGDHAKAPPGFGSALYRALPKEDRKALRGQLSSRHKAGSKDRVRNFEILSAALREVPFDPETVQDILLQQSQSLAELQSNLQGQWLEQVTDMTDAERALYADRLDEVVRHGPHGKKRKN